MSHTPKTFQDIHFYFTKSEETSRWILYSFLLCLGNNLNIYFLFLHSLSRLHKVTLNWLRSLTTEFARQKFRTRRENPNSIQLIWKARKNPPKGHTKNSFLHNFRGYNISHNLFNILILIISWILLWWVISHIW